MELLLFAFRALGTLIVVYAAYLCLDLLVFRRRAKRPLHHERLDA